MIGSIDNLKILIRDMQPTSGGDFAFSQIDIRTYQSLRAIPLAMFREAEGITVIFPLSEVKDLGLTAKWVGTLITLNVNSSLDAVGFLAVITNRLAAAGISVNAFSPVSHDHLFVKPSDAARTMQILNQMSREVSSD